MQRQNQNLNFLTSLLWLTTSYLPNFPLLILVILSKSGGLCLIPKPSNELI